MKTKKIDVKEELTQEIATFVAISKRKKLPCKLIVSPESVPDNFSREIIAMLDVGVGGKTEWSIRQQCKFSEHDKKWHLATMDVFVTTQTIDGTREDALRALASQAQVSFKLARQVMQSAEKEGKK